MALVDGTNGDTILHDVDATARPTRRSRRKAASSTRRAARAAPSSLHATIDKGQLPDVLRLALDDAEPFMNGLLSLRSLLNLPPGEPWSSIAWSSTASSTIEQLRFASDAVQDKVDEFSRRGRGRPSDVTIQNVASTMHGGFQLKDGVLRFTCAPVRRARCAGAVERLLCAARRRAGFPWYGAAATPARRRR